MQELKSIKRENSKKEKLRAHSGITLIALIITIIVLLILAGVALASLFGDNGILNNAESAKNQTNYANSKEQVQLAIQGALTEGLGTITKANLVAELDKLLGAGEENYTITGEEAGPWEVTVTKTGYKTTISSTGKITEQPSDGGGDTTTLPTGEGTTPWLPSANFSQVAGTDLTTGLVIANTTNGKPGTQNYVWIEVPTTISASITREGKAEAETVTLEEAETDDEIREILEVYAGKGTETNYRSSSYVDKWYDSNGKTADTEGVDLTDTAGCGMNYAQYQDAYSKMLNSIKDNGGFWLAQYEAGIAYEAENAETATNRTEHTAIGDDPSPANYAKDQYPYNFVYCSEAQKIANADSVKGKYTSSLPFGIQWDLVCKFLEVKTDLTYADIAKQSTWGNYKDTTYTPSSQTAKYSIDFGKSFAPVYVNEETDQYEKTESGSVLLTTGAIEEATATVNSQAVTKDTNPMNIYDFAGNVREWTLEYTARTSYPCAYRGGGCGSDSNSQPASNRISNFTTDGSSYGFGFRCVLY